MDDSDHHHAAEEEALTMGLDGTWLLELYGLSDQLQHPQEIDRDEYGFAWPGTTLSDQALDAQNPADQDRESPQVGRGSDDEASQDVDVSRSRRATSPPYSPPNPSQRRILQWFEDLPAQYDAFAEAVANSPVDSDPAFQILRNQLLLIDTSIKDSSFQESEDKLTHNLEPLATRRPTSICTVTGPRSPTPRCSCLGIPHTLLARFHSSIKESCIEDNPFEDSPIKDHPIEDSLIENSVIKASIAMDRSNENNSIENSPVENNSLKDGSIRDSFVKNSIVKDFFLEDRSIRDSSIRDNPNRDRSIKHSLIEEHSFKNTYANWSPHTSDTSSSSSRSPEQPAADHGESHQSVRGLDRSLYPDTGAALADSSLRPASMSHTSSTPALRPARSAVQDQQSLEAVRGYGGSLPQAGGVAMDDQGFRSRNPSVLANRPSGTVDGAAQHRQPLRHL
ncbi:hypothetical protein LQW54_009542 [Pestalotiopsis sp. IQ-011]